MTEQTHKSYTVPGMLDTARFQFIQNGSLTLEDKLNGYI